ncbi:WXG100 family type VII secretion target [Paenibacillus polygoni]|uniref:WXG100 family type VII secretion target n=1 Tax=Paenibacillus polygoni TaxID=3050112 RepID=A0ABY8X8Q9_9BACL|nr:WXG100 family type VII secretion target [Paenibacillus polygoni]WIV19856.1 WXG100 family type VII secretion target [Paenibacillus polygoni]
MVKIMVSPDQLMEVARHFLSQRQELERMCNQLDKQIYFISEGWSGATKERFFHEYLSARQSMGVTMEKISSIAQQLNFIARSFAEADGEGGSAIVMPSLPPKVEAKLESAVDYIFSGFRGVGATIEGLFNNVVGTGKSLWENPFGTAYDIGYAFTVGRVVDVCIGARFAWDYAWGSGTARADAEQFVEQMKQDIEEKGTGYYAGYVASQAAAYLTIGKLLKGKNSEIGGSGGKGKTKDSSEARNTELSDVEIKYPLSTTNKKHINKHNIESIAQQSKYLSDDQLADKLESSFFNPKWSKEEINKYAEIAYNHLKSQGKTGHLTYEIEGEIIEVFIHPDGQFGTVYGRHKFTVGDIKK